MWILLLGTGPASGVRTSRCAREPCYSVMKGRGKTARTRSSALVSESDFNLLIDCSPDFEKQIKREKIERVDAAILTHAHRDASGGMGRLPPEVPVYAERQTIRRISKRFKKREFDWHILKPVKGVKIGPFSVTPFRVLHSYTPEFPTLGFRIGRLAYASDVRKIPKESWRFVEGADVLVLDAAFWFGYKLPNHFSVEEAIAIGKEAGARRLILTQIGNTYPSHEKAQKEIAKYGRNIILGYDGLRLSV